MDGGDMNAESFRRKCEEYGVDEQSLRENYKLDPAVRGSPWGSPPVIQPVPVNPFYTGPVRPMNPVDTGPVRQFTMLKPAVTHARPDSNFPEDGDD